MIVILITKDSFSLIFTSDKDLQQAVAKLAYLLGVTRLLNSIQPVRFMMKCYTNNASSSAVAHVCLLLEGVAIGGGGWQAMVAYINLGCYYIFGLPLGYLGTLGGHDMWNCSPNLASVDCALQNQLEQRGGASNKTREEVGCVVRKRLPNVSENKQQRTRDKGNKTTPTKTPRFILVRQCLKTQITEWLLAVSLPLLLCFSCCHASPFIEKPPGEGQPYLHGFCPPRAKAYYSSAKASYSSAAIPLGICFRCKWTSFATNHQGGQDITAENGAQST